MRHTILRTFLKIQIWVVEGFQDGFNEQKGMPVLRAQEQEWMELWLYWKHRPVIVFGFDRG